MVKTTNQLVTNHCESWDSLGIINYQQLATIYQLAQDFASIHSSYGSHGPFGLVKYVRKAKHMTRWEILTFETIDLILDYHRFEGYGQYLIIVNWH